MKLGVWENFSVVDEPVVIAVINVNITSLHHPDIAQSILNDFPYNNGLVIRRRSQMREIDMVLGLCGNNK